MSNEIKCPVCRNLNFENFGGNCKLFSTNGRDSTGFECSVCGKFEISSSAFFGALNLDGPGLPPIQKAALSHCLRVASREGAQILITTDWLKTFLSSPSLPSPAIQAANIIRYIGDEFLKSGEKLAVLPLDFHSIIGSPSREVAVQLAVELSERNILSLSGPAAKDDSNIRNIYLTLDGWEKYEEEKTGKFSGKYGFIAMKFNDPILDPFINEVVKPAIKDDTGYEVVDLRNVSRAGIIDNIMRNQIREAAFVIVDLTHDNPGAYWEAGYAEGLGKPVVYICEKDKFEKKNTHFDTNHCTTVPWEKNNSIDFCRELIATLRRSLNLFPAPQ